MKVLYYNWVDFEDPHKRGGGVSVYQKNLIDAAAAHGDESVFLSSGTSYSVASRRPFVRPAGKSAQGCPKFEIVNSTVVSPGGLAFDEEAAADPAMEALFADFLRAHGPFDAVHFNNLEGVPASFPGVARRHGGGKVVVSLHNYFPFCPQVNLWFQERKSCDDFAGGRKCVNCLPEKPNPGNARKDYSVQHLFRRIGIAHRPYLNHWGLVLLYDYIRPLSKWARLRAARVRTIYRPTEQPKTSAPVPLTVLAPDRAAEFVDRRAAFVDALNRDADHVLAVSDRVAEIAVRLGVRADKVATAYIGTKFAQVPLPADKEPWDGDRPLSLAYLGYMRADKGFYFLLKALEKMPAELARRLSLTVAAKLTDGHAVRRLRRIAHKFAAVTLYDGYTHAALPDILAGVDLGIVPVLWEDNLPQVAIEMVGSGVPVLASDRGGAKELLGSPDLTFRAGSLKDFYAKLRGVLAEPALLDLAMRGRMRLLSPDDHYRELRAKFYSTPAVVSARRAA